MALICSVTGPEGFVEVGFEPFQKGHGWVYFELRSIQELMLSDCRGSNVQNKFRKGICVRAKHPRCSFDLRLLRISFLGQHGPPRNQICVYVFFCSGSCFGWCSGPKSALPLDVRPFWSSVQRGPTQSQVTSPQLPCQWQTIA